MCAKDGKGVDVMITAFGLNEGRWGIPTTVMATAVRTFGSFGRLIGTFALPPFKLGSTIAPPPKTSPVRRFLDLYFLGTLG